MVSVQDLQVWQSAIRNPQGARRKANTAIEAFQSYFAKADAQLRPAASELTDDDVVGTGSVEWDLRKAILEDGR